jgi:hypothetical protein
MYYNYEGNLLLKGRWGWGGLTIAKIPTYREETLPLGALERITELKK